MSAKRSHHHAENNHHDQHNTTGSNQAQEASTTAPGTAAHRPTDWTQLSFGLNVPTWREEMKQEKKAK